MHFCGIVIKPVNVTTEKAREILGEKLVKIGLADWYSTDSYRERGFADSNNQNGKIVESLKEFKLLFGKWLGELKKLTPQQEFIWNNVWAFGIVNSSSGEDDDCYLDEFFAPHEFYEFYDQKYIQLRRSLVNTYVTAYKKRTMELIDKLLAENPDGYNVILLDYHN